MRDKKGRFKKGNNKGGISPNKGNHHTLEVKKRISLGNLGKIISKKTRQKISIANLGKIRSLETKLKISKAKKGIKTPWMENRFISDLTKNKMSKSKIILYKDKENHPRWKGSAVGYRALHIWVRKILGYAIKCEYCGKLKTTQKSIHWANKSHKYLRELTDWVSLCVKCHKRYDKNHRRKQVK